MKKLMFYMFNLSGGGAERTIVNIVNNLDKEKFQVTLVVGSSRNNDYIEFISPEVNLILLNFQRQRNVVFKLAQLIKESTPDLLFSTLNDNNLILMISQLLSFKKIPIIVRETNNRTAAGRVTKINSILTGFFYNNVATRVVALSAGVKEDLINNFRISEDKIDLIYNPVDTKLIKEKTKEVVTDFSFPEDSKIIISVGRLAEQKDYITLIKAFNLVQKKENTHLIILGKGPEKEKLEKLCQELNLSNHITFLGFKKNPYKYMGKSHLFVLSSKWEGFGHVVVEAMAAGLPVVSTNCPSGPSEIIQENTYGRLVPVEEYEKMANEILYLLNDKVRKHYVFQGEKRKNDFDIRIIVKEYESIILQLIDK